MRLCISKALRSSDLIQTTVPVYRNGKTFQRKQWVKRSQLKTVPKMASPKNKVSNNTGGSSAKGSFQNETHSITENKKEKPNLGTNTHLKNKGGKVYVKNTGNRFSYEKFLKLKNTPKKAMEYLISCGIHWEESKTPHINWMRACTAAKKNEGRDNNE